MFLNYYEIPNHYYSTNSTFSDECSRRVNWKMKSQIYLRIIMTKIGVLLVMAKYKITQRITE